MLECQRACLKQAPNLKFKLLQWDLNPQRLSLLTNNHLAELALPSGAYFWFFHLRVNYIHKLYTLNLELSMEYHSRILIVFQKNVFGVTTCYILKNMKNLIKT